MTELTSEFPVWHHSQQGWTSKERAIPRLGAWHIMPPLGGLIAQDFCHTDENKGKWEGEKLDSSAWKEEVKRKNKSDWWWGSGFQTFPDGTDKQTECECTLTLSHQPWASRAWMNTCKAYFSWVSFLPYLKHPYTNPTVSMAGFFLITCLVNSYTEALN